MSGIEVPKSLLEYKKAFIAAEERLAKLARSHPAPTAIAAREAELTDKQIAEWGAAQAELQRLALEISRHRWLAPGEERFKRWMALQAAAKADD